MSSTISASRAAAVKSIKAFQSPHHATSVFQAVSTIGALLCCHIALYWGVSRGFYVVLLLMPIASGLSIRTFTLQHDCGHGSLFRSSRVNHAVGRLCSLLTLTPYDHWRRHHAIHHGDWNNIDSRGRLSDMYSDCTTVREYYAMSGVQRLLYRIGKNPIVSVFLLPPVIFFIVYRIPFDAPSATWRRERWGVYLTNLTLLAIYGTLAWFFGFWTTFLIAFGVVYPAAVVGVSLFLVQHSFEGVHWERTEQWNAFDASLTGCSFLRLPAWLNWFSGSIGLHHIHHAAPGIPNYRLAECHAAHPVFKDVKVIGLGEGVRSLFRHELWDEGRQEMIPFEAVHRGRPATRFA